VAEVRAARTAPIRATWINVVNWKSFMTYTVLYWRIS
jgi:hypothetical protein